MNIKIAKFIHCLLFVASYTFCSSSKKATTLYCHGLNCKGSKVQGFLDRNIIQSPARGFDFNDKKKCLGQADDIATLKKQVASSNENYILYGRSRGGATIMSYLAQHNPTNVQAIVIDAAPADVIDRVDEIQYEVGAYVFQSRAHKEWILRQLYPGYPKNSIAPVDSISQIQNKELPVFLVHSDNDNIVNIRAALKNYKAFKQAQFPHVYLCKLQHGGHAHNAKGADSHIYKTALHSFYKHHGFQHDAEHARLDNLAHLQPTIEDIDNQIATQENKLQEKFQKTRARNIVLGVHAACIAAAILQKK